MASAKDIDIYKTNDYGLKKKPSGVSSKEWAQNKMLQAANNLTNAKTFKFNAEQNQIARNFNHAEAALSRQWQETMSNTAHQREVKDLVKAGLNPVLSANTGAQSYTTNAASIAGASGKADSAASAIASYGGAYMSSQATKYSANQSAAAMKYSANMNYAAAQASAAAAMYAADKNLEATKYQTDHSKSGSLYGILDNMIKSLGDDDDSNPYKRTAYALMDGIKQITNGKVDIESWFYPGKAKTSSNLTESGYANIIRTLNNAAIEANKATQNAMILLATGNGEEQKQALRILSKYKKKKKK